jgi:hypothetical protein
LHVTLVPPKVAASGTAANAHAERVRFKAFQALRARVGSWVLVDLLCFRLARWRGGERCIGFWEVGRVEGIPDDMQYAPQQEKYHVTDTASLVGCTAKEAGDVLAAFRAGTLGVDWVMESFPLSAECEHGGAVQVHAVVKAF